MHIGGCFCGNVRYQVLGEGRYLCYCHCRSCRRASGAPMVAWGTFDGDTFALTRGELTVHRSSPDVERGHCARCGSSLTYRRAERPQEIDINLVTLDESAALVPRAHIWLQDKLPWVQLTDGLAQYAAGLPTS